MITSSTAVRKRSLHLIQTPAPCPASPMVNIVGTVIQIQFPGLLFLTAIFGVIVMYIILTTPFSLLLRGIGPRGGGRGPAAALGEAEPAAGPGDTGTGDDAVWEHRAP